jgi:ferritin-like metal-binding protein YciE
VEAGHFNVRLFAAFVECFLYLGVSFKSKSSQTKVELTFKKSQFYELFLSELKEMLWIEQKTWAMLRLMQEVAQSSDFSRTLAQGRVHASAHIDRIRHVFESLEEAAGGSESAAMKRLMEPVETAVVQGSELRDTGDLPMIIAAQKAGQFKIACYENLITLIQILGQPAIEEILESNIIDDAGTDLLLRELSERYIYKEAAARKAVDNLEF